MMFNAFNKICNLKRDKLVFDKESFAGKKIKCVWCDNYTESVCSVKKIKIKARKSRRCDRFIPNSEAITREIQRGSGIQTIKLSPMAYMSKSEKKRYIEEQKKRLDEALRQDTQHPLTGDLSQFKTTAE